MIPAPALEEAAYDRPTAINLLGHFLVGSALRLFWGGPVISGLERIPAEGPLLVACNHVHFMDTLLMPVAVQRVRYIRLLGKEELFRYRASAWLIRELGVIKLDRARGDVSALKRAIEVLERGGCLGIFPEGTRARAGKALKPKAGVGFLAHKTGAPVVPARVWNTEKFPKPVTMRIAFGPPMRYAGDGLRESCQEFAEQVMRAIFDLRG